MRTQSHYPSLLLVTSKEEAYWYEVKENRLNKLSQEDTKEWNMSDKEGHFEKSTQGETIGTTGIDIENAEEKEIINKHSKSVAKKTKELWQDNYKHLMIATPDYLKNVIEEKIEDKLNKTEYKNIEGNYTHSPKDQLLRLAKDSLKVINE